MMKIQTPIFKKIISLKKIEIGTLPEYIQQDIVKYNDLNNHIVKIIKTNELFNDSDNENLIEDLYSIDAIISENLKAIIKTDANKEAEEIPIPKPPTPTEIAKRRQWGLLNRIS